MAALLAAFLHRPLRRRSGRPSAVGSPLAGQLRRSALISRCRVRPGEFHPEPLTDPDLTLSRHPARATNRRLPPSVENWSSSCRQLARSRPQ